MAKGFLLVSYPNGLVVEVVSTSGHREEMNSVGAMQLPILFRQRVELAPHHPDRMHRRIQVNNQQRLQCLYGQRCRRASKTGVLGVFIALIR